MNNQRHVLFLIEHLFSIFIFILCSVICLNILISSYINQRLSTDINNSVILSKNIAAQLNSLIDLSQDTDLYYSRDLQVSTEFDYYYHVVLQFPALKDNVFQSHINIKNVHNNVLFDSPLVVRK